uniref:Uncharacterized protein LOC114335737 n=1 Tax=Diabrotica virgifera virgifera TaxID=50390 RepID=A0A6P7FZ38_DIAVI
MSTLLNQPKENRKVKACKDLIDFSKVGGLDHHLKTLRELIIFPLLHGHIFAHFKIKAPRGVLFYGPPGTGKTLVAGALVAELNKEGIGKVSFFQRKGADVLDKWVGESEKNLRTLFEKAIKSRPSVIFFDELDGLAPTRNDKNDHIHSSVVATLLSLMDGLDSKPGVIVIGATNRIEAIDPALRRKGRFDKELYFPLPGVQARKEIIQVHTNNWKYKPPQKFIEQLADVTPGYCGSDIQALCSEAVMYCLKRTYPNINCKGFNVKIEAASLRVDECDFLEAKLNLIPSSMKQGMKMRNFSDVIRPLLIRQHKKIVKYINTLWPHFLQEEHRFTCGERRYAGRMLLIGNNLKGLNTHMIPSLLKTMEHLPTFVYDSGVFNLHNFFYNNSTIVVKIENPNQQEREDFFAPLFFDNEGLSVNSVWNRLRTPEKQVIKCEDNPPPTQNAKKRKRKSKIDQEVERLGKKYINYVKMPRHYKRKLGFRKYADYTEEDLKACLSAIKDGMSTRVAAETFKIPRRTIFYKLKGVHAGKPGYPTIFSYEEKRCFVQCIQSLSDAGFPVTGMELRQIIKSYLNCQGKNITRFKDNTPEEIDDDEPIYISTSEKLFDPRQCFTKILSDLINKKGNFEEASDCTSSDKGSTSKANNEIYEEKIYNLWRQVSTVTSKNMAVAQLELLYDVISTCIGIYQNSIDSLLQNLENVLKQTETSYEVQVDY